MTTPHDFDPEGGVDATGLPSVALLAAALGLPVSCSAHRPTETDNELDLELEPADSEPAPASGWRGEVEDPLSETGSWP